MLPALSHIKTRLRDKWRFTALVFWKPAYLNLLSISSFLAYKALFYFRAGKEESSERGRIGIDAKILRNNVSGIERYMYQLTVHLSKIEKDHGYSVFIPQPIFNDKVGSNFKEEIEVDLKKLITSQNRKIAFREIEVFHVTWQEMFLYHNLPLLWSKSSVITVHDLINMLCTEYHRPLRRAAYKILLKCAVRWADRIITVSEYTKQDIMKYLNADEKKIRVIYLACDDRFKPVKDKRIIASMKRKYCIQGKYILSVGKSYTHKNIPHLIRAYKKLISKENIAHKLVLVGEKYWGPSNMEVESLITEFNLEAKIIWLGYIDDVDMPTIYNGADLFVLPSCYEGFGLPLLEAMSCGTPLIASNVTSMPEIVGDAGILVSPTDVDELTRSMETVLKDKELRKLLIKKGLERSKHFSWEKCARETQEVYDDLLTSL